jgi:hypothetical protein
MALIPNDPMLSLRTRRAVIPNQHNKNYILHKVPVAMTEADWNTERPGANVSMRASSYWMGVEVTFPCAELIKHYAINT